MLKRIIRALSKPTIRRSDIFVYDYFIKPNPFTEKFCVEIVDIKAGWVKYRFKVGSEVVYGSQPLRRFHFNFIREMGYLETTGVV